MCLINVDNMKNKKIFITAGEASGDLLGSKIISAIKSNTDNIEFIGIGGKKMLEEGISSIFPIKDLSVMGFFEVLPRIFLLSKRINQTVNKILEEKPDLILTIDSPGFSFRVMEKLKSKDKKFFDSVKKVHLIAPSVWAYKEKRAEKISKLYNLLLCILPFEPPYFEKYGLKTKFIGHPIFDNSNKYRLQYSKNELSKIYNISQDDFIMILTPGSREGEITRIFPIMIKTIEFLKCNYEEKYKNLNIFTFVNENTKDLVNFMNQDYDFESKIIIDENEKQKIMSVADIVLAKSGTNTFEFNIYNIPMVITYTFNWLTNKLAKKMVKVKYANLVNIIADKEIIPEFVLDNADPYLISEEIHKILNNKDIAKQQVEDTIEIIKKLGYSSDIKASKIGANKILELLNE